MGRMNAFASGACNVDDTAAYEVKAMVACG
jgi:hypothetical protein